MTNLFRIALFAVACLLLTSVAAQSIPDSLTPAQVREDLDFVARTIGSMHPNPWHDMDRSRFYRLLDSMAGSVRHNVGSEEVYPLAARLCAAINEGHTHAWPTPLSQKIIAGKIPVFPLLLRDASENGFYVQADLSGDSLLRAGDRIVSINGQSTLRLFPRFLAYYGGLPAWRRSRVQNDLLVMLHVSGVRAPYRVRYVRNGKLRDAALGGLAYSMYKSRRDAYRRTVQTPAKESDYAFGRIEGNVGLLRFNSMEGDPSPFWNFLEETFRGLQQQPVTGLLIDLRRNGGGNSLLGWYLLQFLTDKPFRMSGDVYWKMSPQVRTWYGGLDTARRRAMDTVKWAGYLAHKDGELIVFPAAEPTPPDTNSLRFRGPVAVLIGPHTFSSANMTAATIGDYKLATLIGEPTGEPANDYGEVLYFDTPNARVNFGSCTKLFVRPSGNRNDTRPVLPDIPVKTDPRRNEDAVLQAALRWLARQGVR